MLRRSSLFFALLFAPAFASAATYYVDNAVSTSGTGLSWAAAWKNFSNINWTTVVPGDTIYISGGSTSKTYNETLAVNDDGTSGSRITITKGVDAGHNGTVIIDGQSTRLTGVEINGDDYITIRGFDVKNHIGDAPGSPIGQIWVANSTGDIIENNSILVTGHAGLAILQNTNVIARKNTITTPTSTSAQTDGIYSQDNVGNIYEGNSIVISNTNTDGHNDCIQFFRDNGATVRDNYCNPQYSLEQGIFMSEGSGTYKVYNNVVNAPGNTSALISLFNDAIGTAILNAYNNTVIGGKFGAILIWNSPNSIVKNNIVRNDVAGAALMRVKGTLPAAANINHNLYYAPNSSNPFFNENTPAYLTYAQWQALGYDANGINNNPDFVNSASNFQLQSSSPARDAGTTISDFNWDHSGVTRPQGQVWDMGAYEFVFTTPAPHSLYLEAESGTLVAPMTTGSDANASGGSYVSSTTDVGTAAYTFTVPSGTEGTFYVWARVLSPDSASDSFYVKMDSGTEDTYDTVCASSPSASWQWTEVNGRDGTANPCTLNPRTFSLSASSHTLTFRGRELGTKLDRIFITNQANDVPGCHLKVPPPPEPPPFGFSYPWNVFTEEVVQVAVCNPNDTVSFTVGDGQFTTLIWKNGAYTKNSSSWQPTIEFAGPAYAGSDWIVGEGSFTTPVLTTQEVTSLNYMAAYVCTFRSGLWKCGCTDADLCTSSGLWGLQAWRGPA